ncbi:MAG TPA: hypothetical protein VEN29_05180 [Casimicrobiaceae bacterium]|nr:hypothetical protein [Casimicrobiaceae bacterium]
MKQPRALKSVPTNKRSQSLAVFATRLTGVQLEALKRCANGISLRFDASEIVDPLIAAGYVKRGVAGIITVTAEGHQYLQKHAD